MEEQLTAVGLNKEIVGLFFCLSSADSNEAAVTFITQIDQKLHQHKNLINAPTYAMLFYQLSKLDHGKQIIAKKLLEFTIAHTGEYFKKHSREFNLREIGQLICAFPKLPVTWTNYTRFVVRVLKRLYKILEDQQKFDDKNLISILSALAKLGFFVEEPLPLLLKLLDALNCTEEKIQILGVSSASELWLFCVYAKSRFEKEERIVQLFVWIDTHLKQNPQKTGDINESHIAIAELLKQNLKAEFSDEVQLEYSVGAYALDIAIPGLKLNIEVDGRQHYRAENLVRKDKFRDHVLKYYEGWTTIRIPLKEYNQCQRKERLDYLKEKLSGFEHIFKPISPNVTEGLAKHHLLNNSNIRSSKPSNETTQKNRSLEKK